MVQITFPDKQVKSFEKAITPYEIACSISQQLASKVLVAKVNKVLWDMHRPIYNDADIALLTWESAEAKSTFWHSTAHLMAEAVEKQFPFVKFWVGPPIDNGFYYDIDFGDKTLTEKDLISLEQLMLQLANEKNKYIRKEISKSDAIRYFQEKGDMYKLDLLENLEDGQITFYTQGTFTDLCRGPHIPHTGFIKAIKLLNIAGAYWKGDDKNKQLTRLYGTSFPTQKELTEYLTLLEEAKKRDHRKLGKELGIFCFDDQVGPGLPLWLPNGAIIIEQLESLAKISEERHGYKRVVTPHLAKESLYITSGHIPYYKDSMFPAMEIEGQRYYLKAMNCPHHHKIYSSQPRSYKDLPLRLAEYGTCYRYEQSGELFGLMRVRCLHMNDAHIYCTKDQFAHEFKAVNAMYVEYFKIFGIQKFVMRLSLHDPAKLGKKYVNEPILWNETESMVREALQDSQIPFVEVADEAAFYGPKIDVQIWSAIGREFTLATNQVDFAQSRSFNLSYINEHNQPDIPLIIHRAPLGTHERFIGFLLEHYAGNFPTWLTPVQVIILPISEHFLLYAKEVYQICKQQGLRLEIDTRNEKIGKKIRDAEMLKIPYMVLIGEKEQQAKSISIRKHGKGDIGMQSIELFLKNISNEIQDYQ